MFVSVERVCQKNDNFCPMQASSVTVMTNTVLIRKQCVVREGMITCSSAFSIVPILEYVLSQWMRNVP